MRRKIFILVLGMFSGFTSYSQLIQAEQKDLIQYQGDILDTARAAVGTIDYAAEINLRGLAASGERLPFWMYNNQRGRVYDDTNISGWITGRGIWYLTNYSFLEAGGGVLYQDGNEFDEIIPEEYFVHFENSWLKATLGRKQREAKYGGISASNENILWSLNSRPLTGIQVSTNGPIYLNNGRLGFEASWNEYLLGDDRYYENPGLHHKSIHLLYRTENNFRIKVGLQHFAHYGGETTEGKEPPFTNYWDAVTFKHPTQNHLSSYELYLNKEFRTFDLELLYNHIAMDLTGRRLGNTPDGRYGIFYENHDPDKIISSIMYEFYYTQHQSHTSSSGFVDNYFNHTQYRTGWAFKDHIMGAPFFTYDTETNRVVNNKFTAHHLGLKGQYSTPFNIYPYELLLSYSLNDGTYERRYRPKQEIVAAYFDIRLFESAFDVNLQLASEFNSVASPLFGAAIHLKYQFGKYAR